MKIRGLRMSMVSIGVFVVALALAVTAGVVLAAPLNGKIAFHSDRDGDFEIYVVGADGSNVTQLTSNPAVDGSPAWSANARSVAPAAGWAGHQTGGGDGTVLAPPPDFVGISPLPGTSISFSFVAKADSLVPAPVPPPPAPPPPPGLLVAAPGATIQGHATWVDHSTSPPRVISLTNPLNFLCNPVRGGGAIAGWGTDSSIPGPVFVIFATVDGQAPGGPLDDQVDVRVSLAPPGAACAAAFRVCGLRYGQGRGGSAQLSVGVPGRTGRKRAPRPAFHTTTN